MLRPGTIDRRIFRHVVIENEYRLPDRFAATDVILDVGAHVGSFALACLRRGAGRVVCLEPDPGNFRLLTHNLRPFAVRVVLHNAAAWRNDVACHELSIGNPLDVRNTGAVRVAEPGTSVKAVALDDMLREAGRVRLLKLDCEGAEWPVLLTAAEMGRVAEVCGEYHLGTFPELYAVEDVAAFTPEVLRRTLEGHGFRAELHDAPGST